MIEEEKLVQKFYEDFNNKHLKFQTKKKDYDIRAVWPKLLNTQYDLSIKIVDKIIAVLEFKTNLNSSYKFFKSKRNPFWTIQAKFHILTDGTDFIVFNGDENLSNKTLDFEGFVELLLLHTPIDIEASKQSIMNIIRKKINESNFQFIKEQQSINENHNYMYELEYDEIHEVFYFKDHHNMHSFENRFFRSLLKDEKKLNRIYRYTNLGTIYSSLNHNTYRMNCIIGMNDTSEVNYAENYVSGVEKSYEDAHWKTIENYNNRFISSFSLKKDDLTQWRLYADDSKGVCMVFTVNDDITDSTFILKRVSYSKKNRQHPELDLIKEIVFELENFGITFEFRTLNIWKHFFKPHEYAVEEEVRLLYIHNDELDTKRDWLLTSSHQILNPYVEFKLNDSSLPIQLKEIVLGPKSPEKLINKKQFEQYIRELRKQKDYDLNKVSVEISSIKNYR